MRPLVSGEEAKRFIEPSTSTYLLFPYSVDKGVATAFDEDTLALKYPKAAAYLRRFEVELRKINKSQTKVDSKWFRYSYPKNLARQDEPKIVVAQLVPDLRLAFDDRGSCCLDNVRVNGILPRGDNGWFLLGVLNAPTSNYVFKWLGKPKDNGYFEANKQFIAPLPIPTADRTSRASLSALAKGMQQRNTDRVRRRAALEERLAATARLRLPLERLLDEVRAIAAIEASLPASVPPSDRKRWIDEQRSADEEAALARIDALFRLDSTLDVVLVEGKLSFRIDERPAARLFVSDGEAALVAAQWRSVALDFQPRGKDDAKRLIERLRRIATDAEPALAAQIIAIGE